MARLFPFLSKKHVRTPTIIQMEITECGAAALTIMLGYYDCYVPLEKMRIECGVSRDGSNAENIIKAARRRGMEAYGIETQSIDALNDLKLPFIVHWNFNHFVIVEGIRKNKYYLNDPATGPRTVTRDEFDQSFTGIALVCKPKKEFKKEGEPFSVYRALLNRLKGEGSSFSFIVLASLLLVIPGIMIPGFSKIFIDDILVRQFHDWLPPLLLGLLITTILMAVLTWLQRYQLLMMQIKIMVNASAKFVWHVLRLPISFFQQRFIGDVQERLGANSRIAELLSGELTSSAVSLVTVIFYGIIMVLLDWQLSIFVIIVAIANMILLYYIARKIADINRVFLQERGRLTGIAMNGLEIIETLKGMGLENYFFSRWATQHSKIINSQQRIILFNQVVSIFPTLLYGFLTVTILGYGCWQIMNGYLTVGTLVAFQALAMSFNAPIMTLLGLASRLQQIRGDLARLKDVEQHPIDPRFGDKKQTLENEKLKMKNDLEEDSSLFSVQGSGSKDGNSQKIYPWIDRALTEQQQAKIKVRAADLPEEKKETHTEIAQKGNLILLKVKFGYSVLEEPLIKDLNLTLKSGKSIAIVGATGSGKSTIAKLICGLYQPWAGEIILNNKTLKEVSSEILAKTLAFVDQDIMLFEGTVLDNLTLWKENYDIDALQKVLSDACLLDVVNERGGLNSRLIARGANFSSGEKQRLEIARALLNQPKILVLDEATSDLDAITEEQICNNIKKRGCSLFIISHRLSAIRDCDEILVLNKGDIIEHGTHTELLKLNGQYRQLVSMG